MSANSITNLRDRPSVCLSVRLRRWMYRLLLHPFPSLPSANCPLSPSLSLSTSPDRPPIPLVVLSRLALYLFLGNVVGDRQSRPFQSITQLCSNFAND